MNKRDNNGDDLLIQLNQMQEAVVNLTKVVLNRSAEATPTCLFPTATNNGIISLETTLQLRNVPLIVLKEITARTIQGTDISVPLEIPMHCGSRSENVIITTTSTNVGKGGSEIKGTLSGRRVQSSYLLEEVSI